MSARLPDAGGPRPRRRMHATRRKWGQHWLASQELARDLIGLVGPAAGESFLEIGPGRGRLTAALLEHPVHVVAVEVDAACCELLAALPAGADRLRVIHADILDADEQIPWEAGPFRAVGNLPYYVSSPILRWTARQGERLVDAHYTVQLEVAERVVAPAGSRAYGLLSVLVQSAFEAHLLRRLPPGAFRPPPRVESAFLRLQPRSAADRPPDPAGWIFVAEAAFAHRRKKLANALALAGFAAERVAGACRKAGVDPGARAERLSPEDFARLGAALGSPS